MTVDSATSHDDPDPLAARLAAEIRRRRHDAGLSHAQLATRIGYSRQYVSIAERARKGLPSAGLVRVIDEELQAGGALIALRERAATARLARRRSHSSAGAGRAIST